MIKLIDLMTKKHTNCSSIHRLLNFQPCITKTNSSNESPCNNDLNIPNKNINTLQQLINIQTNRLISSETKTSIDVVDMNTNNDLVNMNTNNDLVNMNTNNDLVNMNTNNDLVSMNTNNDLVDMNTNNDLVNMNTNNNLVDMNTNNDLVDIDNDSKPLIISICSYLIVLVNIFLFLIFFHLFIY